MQLCFCLILFAVYYAFLAVIFDMRPKTRFEESVICHAQLEGSVLLPGYNLLIRCEHLSAQHFAAWLTCWGGCLSWKRCA